MEKITEKDFFIELRRVYKSSKMLSKFKDYDFNNIIERKRSKIISSVTEEFFAYFLASNLNLDENRYRVFIDIPISFKNELGKSKTIYPDVVICEIQNNKLAVKYLLDLKMDTGFFRTGLEELTSQHLNELNYLIKNETFKNNFIVDKNIAYDIVIVSGKNTNKDVLIKQLHEIKNNNKYLKTSVFLLSSGAHPNKNVEEIFIVEEKGNYSIDHSAKDNILFYYISEFENLLKRIKNIIN